MVFSEFIDNMASLLSSKENSIPQKLLNTQSEMTNELQQGLVLLNNRKHALNQLSNSLLLIESFKAGDKKLDETNQKELQILAALESEFQSKLSEYSRNYKSFMDSYYRAVEDVKTCKARCLSTYPVGSPDYSMKRQGCDAGCTFKGPYLQSCQDTFLTSRVTNQTCAAITKGKCLAGNVILGQNSAVTSASYADRNNTTIKDGCCECGGGAGGPPTVNIRGKNIKNCTQVPWALGFSGASGSYTTSACYSANMPSANVNANLYRNYAALTSQNDALIKLLESILNLFELTILERNIKDKSPEKIERMKRYFIYTLIGFDDIQNYVRKLVDSIYSLFTTLELDIRRFAPNAKRIQLDSLINFNNSDKAGDFDEIEETSPEIYKQLSENWYTEANCCGFGTEKYSTLDEAIVNMGEEYKNIQSFHRFIFNRKIIHTYSISKI